ncbi:hypothetical protein KAI78_09590 [bacterium]|nr:hypothetical protein [bacterium]
MKKLLLLLLAVFIIALPVFAEESEKAIEESKSQLEKTISSDADVKDEKQEQIDELRFISQLPAKMQELLAESKEEAKKVIYELKQGHLKAQETVAVMDTIRDNDKEGISNEGMGEYVREQVRSGKRGRELSDSIKKENSKRRENKRHMKRENKKDGSGEGNMHHGENKGGKGKGKGKDCDEETRKKHGCKEEVKKESKESTQTQRRVFEMEKTAAGEEASETDEIKGEKKEGQAVETKVLEMKKKSSGSRGGKR